MDISRNVCVRETMITAVVPMSESLSATPNKVESAYYENLIERGEQKMYKSLPNVFFRDNQRAAVIKDVFQPLDFKVIPWRMGVNTIQRTTLHSSNDYCEALKSTSEADRNFENHPDAAGNSTFSNKLTLSENCVNGRLEIRVIPQGMFNLSCNYCYKSYL